MDPRSASAPIYDVCRRGGGVTRWICDVDARSCGYVNAVEFACCEFALRNQRRRRSDMCDNVAQTDRCAQVKRVREGGGRRIVGDREIQQLADTIARQEWRRFHAAISS